MSIFFERGSLLAAIDRTTEAALHSGALIPIQTGCEVIEDHGIPFAVRVLTNLARKDEQKKVEREKERMGEKPNPFLPYETELLVTEISDTHIALLNKFNVMARHLLLVTRQFEDQENLLTLADFEALWSALTEFPSLGFYNGGEAAGASQRHKHLQVVPLPLAPGGPAIPFAPLFASAQNSGDVREFPFEHAFHYLEPAGDPSPENVAPTLLSHYRALLRTAGLRAEEDQVCQSAPYCFLMTREWMLIVPRSREFYDGISINSLGFAGALLVRDALQRDLVAARGPMHVLTTVAVPRA